MRKTMLMAAMLSLTVLMFAAAPAMANNNNDNNNDNNVQRNSSNIFDDGNRNDIFDNGNHIDDGDEDWWGFWGLAEVDVETENVGENNALEGECIVTDIDGDEEIEDWEIELTCYV
jgi:hypothetical protein